MFAEGARCEYLRFGDIVQVGLRQLIDGEAGADVDGISAAAGTPPQPDVTTPEGLRAARSQLSSRPADPRATPHVAGAGGRWVPVRIITPAQGEVRAVYLHIHGGGFYMDSASRSDARNVRLADAVGVAAVSVTTGSPPRTGGRPHPTTARRRPCGWSRAPRRCSARPGF